MTNAPEYSCECGARFYTIGAYHTHFKAWPRKCLKAARKPLSPEEYAANNPSEHGQQVALFMWAALPETLKLYPALEYMFAIPNGGLRDRITATRLKAEGVKSGVPDVFLPAAVRHPTEPDYFGLFIEMKRPGTQSQREGKLSDAQLIFAHYIASTSYCYRTCYSFQEARDTIIRYLGQND